MPEIDVRPFRNPNNIDILNAIRKNASVDYQRRIPAATKANLQETINNLINYRPSMNEFADALVNQIGLVIVKNNTWTNTLAKFKRGMLMYGDTIEEINVGLITATRYDPDREYLEQDIFGQDRPDVQASYHKVNRQDKYKISINDAMLKRAFFDEFGLSNFVTQLMNAPTTSDNWDEFLLTASLFKTYHEAGGFFNVQIGDIGASGSDGPDSRYALRRMREMADNLQFISTHYNASGMPIAADPDDLELFVTPEANAAIDVEALAGAFNIEKANFASRTTIIPKEHFNIPGAQAILTTKDFFVIADTLIETRSIINPAGLHTNYFLHHHEVVSASRFVPAILFTTEAGTVINLDHTPVTSVSTPVITDEDGLTVTEVERGGLYNVFTEAITTPTDGVNDAVRYELVGALSIRTRITQTGMLHVSVEEAATSLTVNAYPTDSDDITIVGTVTADVVGDLLHIWPDPAVSTDSDDDGLFEVTPDDLEMDGSFNVTIPTVIGVQYKKAGVNVANGTVHPIAGTVAFTAVGRAGYELATGAPASWSFTH